jgi:Leucine-rich repeat (LRR) protein
LKQLPESFGDLIQLTVLHIDENQLVSLPSTIGLLESLEVLELCDNRIIDYQVKKIFCFCLGTVF